MSSPFKLLKPFTIDTTQSFTFANVTTSGNINATNANLGNAVVANYFVGNGSLLTGLPASYSNSNVAAYLPTYTGNISAGNIITTGTSGNISGANYITANFFVGDGSNVTNVNALALGGHSASYFATSTQGTKADSAVQPGDLATVANTGSYSDLLNKPTLFDGEYASLANKPTLFSGSYTDLTNKPTLGTAAATNANAYATAAQGLKADTAIQSGANISLFTNDSGYLVAANLSGYATESYVGNTVANLIASAPAALDTLNELANALGNDASYSTTITNALANKLSTSNFTSTADSWLSLKTTSNVAEGTNLYYTVARSNTAIDNRVTKSFIDNLGVVASSANSVQGANVTGQVGNALIAGTVYTNAQPNITSVGTLTSLTVAGNITTTGTSGNISGANFITANYFVGDGSLLTGLPASYSNTNVAAYLPTYTGNVSAGNVKTDHLLHSNGSPYVFTSVPVTVSTTAPSSPSEGDLWLDSNTGEMSVYFGGAWASVVSSTSTAITVTGNAQPNITSVGTLSNLNISGNITASYLIGNGSQLTGLPASYANSNVVAWFATQTTSNLAEGTNLYFTDTRANTAITNKVTKSFVDALGINANTINGHADTYFATSTQGTKADSAVQPGANVSVLTNDAGYLVQANLSTYATQTYVNTQVTNLINSAPSALDTLNELANALGNDASFSTTITNGLANKLSISAFNSTANTWLALQTTSNVAEGANLYYTVARANTAIDNRVTKSFVDTLGVVASSANSVQGGNVTGQVGNALIAGTVYSNAQPNITSVGTLTTLNVTGNVTASYLVGNGSQLTGLPASYANSNVVAWFATQTTNNLTEGTNLYFTDTRANTAITNKVTKSFVDALGVVASSANSVQGANVTGQVGNALIAGTVYTNAQPNITSVGSLSSLTVTGTLSLNDISKLYVPGGTANYVLQTNGSGSLSWSAPPVAGNAYISGSNTQLFFNNGSTTLGASANLTFNTGTNTLTTKNLVVNGTTNMGAIGNVTITGGSSNNYLKTDGSGTLSWATLPTTSVTLDSFTGNGTSVNYTLSVTPTSANYTLISVAGIMQPKTTYSLSGNIVTFSEAPPQSAPIEVTTINSGVSAPTGGGSSGYSYQGVSANTTLAVATRYIVNTSASALTLTLPLTANLGDEISVIDGTGNAATNNITINPNGGNIMGASGNMIISTTRAAFTLVYYNASQGWLLTQV